MVEAALACASFRGRPGLMFGWVWPVWVSQAGERSPWRVL